MFSSNEGCVVNTPSDKKVRNIHDLVIYFKIPVSRKSQLKTTMYRDSNMKQNTSILTDDEQNKISF